MFFSPEKFTAIIALCFLLHFRFVVVILQRLLLEGKGQGPLGGLVG